MVFTWFFLCLQ